MTSPLTLTGPFSQILTLAHLPNCGPIADDALEIIKDGGLVHAQGKIIATGNFLELKNQYPDITVEEILTDAVALPGFIDCHTHICFAGSRARDYALRVAGKSYLDIAKAGGGILDTVNKTRDATHDDLAALLLKRTQKLFQSGITTCEVKSGYGLSVAEELKLLQAIKTAQKNSRVDLVPTCLAAHTRPPEFTDNMSYLKDVVQNLLPQVKAQNLARRVDVFVEESAFTAEEAIWYLTAAKKMGFELTVHADQFSTSGTSVAAQVGALSADHLEASGDKELKLLKAANVVAVALPGASLGLGIPFAPARKILDTGLTLAIASDWNPGSAPMGNLLTQAALLGASQKLTLAETFAGITVRAALALGLRDRGQLTNGMRADFVVFPTGDYREILYQQGEMRPCQSRIQGQIIL